MKPDRHLTRLCRFSAAAVLALGGLPAIVSADTLWVGEKAPGLERPKLAVSELTRDGELVYKSQTSGNAGKVELARVVRMSIDGETQLNAAEEAFAKGEWAAALDGYKRAAGASAKPFVKTRAVTRMLESAANSKQFEAQVTAFAELAKLDPALAAKQPKIALPGDKAKLKGVLPVLEQAQAAKPSDALTSLIVEIALAADDVATAQKYTGRAAAPRPPGAQQLPGAADPTPTADMSGQAAGRLNQAKVALKSNNPTGAIQAIEAGGGRAAFTKPDQQFEALTMLAEARGLLARDPATAQEAAVANMRVVAHAATLGKASDPEVATAMFRAAGLIETKLNQPKEALPLYNTLATDKRWEATPAAAEAKKAVARLKGAA